MRSILKRSLLWGVIGSGFAILYFPIVTIDWRWGHVAVFVLCPTSIAFMAVDKAVFTAVDWMREITFLVLTNFALYFMVGLVLTSAWKGLRAFTARRSAAPRTH